MPQAAKGARLWFRKPKRGADGSIAEGGGWVIRDGNRAIRTGFGKNDRARAEEALAAYIAARHINEARTENPRDPASVKIATVIALYLRDKAPKHARPHETAARAELLLDWWGERTLGDVMGRTCREYAAARSTPAAARRELEDLRSAIRYHHKEGLCTSLTQVSLPDKAVPRDRWLTTSEAARLVLAAWRYRETQKGKAVGRHSRRHVARFILVALYTGTRAGAICEAALRPTPGRGWIDLQRGVFYRRASGERETRKRKPPVQIPERLLAHIRRWHRLGISRNYVVEWNGRPVARMAKAFARTAADAGMPDVTPHTLRHTAATWMMQAGTEPWAAGGYLGMSMDTLTANYAHHHPDHFAEAREGLVRRGRPKPSRTASAQLDRNVDRTLAPIAPENLRKTANK